MNKIKIIFGSDSGQKEELKQQLCANPKKTLFVEYPVLCKIHQKHTRIIDKITRELEVSHELIVVGNVPFEDLDELELLIWFFSTPTIRTNHIGRDCCDVPRPNVLLFADATPLWKSESLLRRIDLEKLDENPDHQKLDWIPLPYPRLQ